MIAPKRPCRDEELPCIWVLAGVLSYRPCPFDYDCERCELYHALRGADPNEPPSDEESRTTDPDAELTDQASVYVCALTRGCKLYIDRPYSRCHFWLEAAEKEDVLLGLDSYLMRLLYPIDDITLPPPGVLMKRGEPCGWITRGRMAVPLKAPITGLVRDRNESLLDEVQDRGGVNGGDDWLLRLEAHEDLASVPDLFRGEATLIWYLKKVQALKSSLGEVMTEGSEGALGVLLNDGGEANLDVEDVLGRDRFEALVEEMFRLQI